MKHQQDNLGIDLAGRIRSLEQFTGTLVARPEPVADVIPIHDAPVALAPSPRRARVFLRTNGSFADLTVTAPAPRAASD